MNWKKGAALFLMAAAICFILIKVAPPSRITALIQVPGGSENSESSLQEVRKNPVLSDTLLNVNTATFDELCALKGIGSVLAQRIVDEIAVRGPFRYLEDLMCIKGIGEETLNRLSPYICVR